MGLFVFVCFLVVVSAQLNPNIYGQDQTGEGTYYGVQNPKGTGNCGFAGTLPSFVNLFDCKCAFCAL